MFTIMYKAHFCKSSHNFVLNYLTGGWKFILLVDMLHQQNCYLYMESVTLPNHVRGFEISSS